MWNWHVDNSEKGICDMIVGRCILTGLVINLKLSNFIIKSDDKPIKRMTSPMVDMGKH